MLTSSKATRELYGYRLLDWTLRTTCIKRNQSLKFSPKFGDLRASPNESTNLIIRAAAYFFSCFFPSVTLWSLNTKQDMFVPWNSFYVSLKFTLTLVAASHMIVECKTSFWYIWSTEYWWNDVGFVTKTCLEFNWSSNEEFISFRGSGNNLENGRCS